MLADWRLLKKELQRKEAQLFTMSNADLLAQMPPEERRPFESALVEDVPSTSALTSYEENDLLIAQRRYRLDTLWDSFNADQKNRRRDAADRMIEYFTCLRDKESLTTPGKLILCNDEKSASGPTPKLFEAGLAATIARLYQGGTSLDKLEEQFESDIHVIQLAVIYFIWSKENSTNIEFEPLLLNVELPEVLYLTVRELVFDEPDIGPCELMKRTLSDPLDCVQVLLVVRAQMDKWPKSDVDWNKVHSNIPTYNVNIDCVSKLAAEIESWMKLEKEVRSNTKFEDVVLEANTSSLLDMKNEQQELILKMKELGGEIREARSSQINGLLTERQKEKLVNVPKRIQKYNDAIHAYDEATAAVQSRKSATKVADVQLWALADLLSCGERVLVRRDSRDAATFFWATVVERVSADSFKVKMELCGDVATVPISDIAHGTLKLVRYHEVMPTFHSTRDQGMRVVCPVAHPRYGVSSPKTHLSGVIAQRAQKTVNGKEDYLVFFDDGDCADYVLHEDVHLMLEQSTKPESNTVNRAEVFRFVKDPERRDFIRFVELFHSEIDLDSKYFLSYPDWPLLRMKGPNENQHLQRVKAIRNGHEYSALVLSVDRAMCVLRFPDPTKIPGAGCELYPCPRHKHMDERVFRGSLQLPSLREGREHHGVRSRKWMHRNRAQIEPVLSEELPYGRGADADFSRRMARKSQVLAESSHEEKEDSPFNRPVYPEHILKQRKKQANDFCTEQIQFEPPQLQHHKHKIETCTHECLQGQDSYSPYNPQFLDTPPYFIPVLCGWKRVIQLRARRAKAPSRHIIYRTPCGQSLARMSEVAQFLERTQSSLTIDLFTFNAQVRANVRAVTDPKFLKSDDFAKGAEHMKIPVVNAIDDTAIPSMVYGARRFMHNDLALSTVCKEFCSGCTCTDNCANPDTCECQQLTKKMFNRLHPSLRGEIKSPVYSFRRRLDSPNSSEMKSVKSGVYECNDNCPCSRAKCFNRVVQQPIKIPIQLYQTAQCGWGVRTLVDIPPGAFICNYNGALLNDSLADMQDTGDEYYAELDLIDVVQGEKNQAGIDLLDDDGGFYSGEDSDSPSSPPSNATTESDEDEEERVAARKRARREERSNVRPSPAREDRPPRASPINLIDFFGDDNCLFIVDAKIKGNIGRFLNHSCDPNHCFVDTHDLRLPWVSFFSTRYIPAGEELRWNYGYSALVEQGLVRKGAPCFCCSKNCQRVLL